MVLLIFGSLKLLLPPASQKIGGEGMLTAFCQGWCERRDKHTRRCGGMQRIEQLQHESMPTASRRVRKSARVPLHQLSDSSFLLFRRGWYSFWNGQILAGSAALVPFWGFGFSGRDEDQLREWYTLPQKANKIQWDLRRVAQNRFVGGGSISENGMRGGWHAQWEVALHNRLGYQRLIVVLA